MACLTKKAYEHKREWAARKHEEQKAITTLTEEQHDALAEVCSLRHWFHCNMRDLFYSESADYRELCALFPDGSGDDGRINEILKDAGLEPVRFSVTSHDIPDDSIWELDGYESLDDAFNAAMDMAEQLNSDIEAYLTAIDKRHGTSYAPSGATRIYNNGA